MIKPLEFMITFAILGLLFFSTLIMWPDIIYFLVQNPTNLFIIIWVVYFIVDAIFKYNKGVFKKNTGIENIPQEFEDIYDKLYRNNISSLEKMRKQARWRVVIQYIPLIIFILAFNYERSALIDTIIWIVVMTTMAALITISHKYISKYKETYKSEIIANFIKLINNKLIYKPDSEELLAMKKDYKKASFDNRDFNRFYPDDYIEGFLDDEVFVKIADLHIQHHVNSGKNSHTYEVFQGIFVQTGCNKDIGTYIKISKNQLKVFEQHERVEMDSQEFEKYFDIYSENKILTMQLLTSDVMSTLVDFYNRYNIDYEIAIKNNRIYMRFFTVPMFEPKVFGNSMDKELLLKYYCILKFIVDVTKEVNKVLEEVEI